MKLLQLELTNFQGIMSLKLDFGGESASVYGRNATGKTTIYNALSWLLVDKPSTSAKNYSPKTNSASGEVHNMHHTATATFRDSNGRVVSFGKDYHEIYKKKRGSVTEEFAGHTTDYYVDGVPVSEAQYKMSVLQYAGGTLEQVRMIITPLYFVEEMPWQKRRETLLKISGDIADADVIASTAELDDLPQYLAIPGTQGQQYSVDEYRKIAAEKKRKINQELSSLPARIDEARRAIPDLSGLDEDNLEVGVADLEKQKEHLLEERAQQIGQDTEAARHRALLAQHRAALEEARSRYAAQSAGLNESVYAAIKGRRKEQSELESELASTQSRISAVGRRIEELEERRRMLIEEYTQASKSQWDDGKAICPTCHRPLPAAEIESMKADFNLTRSQRLEAINQRGRKECSQEMIDSERTMLKVLQDKLPVLQDAIAACVAKLQELGQQISKPAPFESTSEYKTLAARVAECEAAQGNADSMAAKLAATKTQEIKELEARIALARRDLQKFEIKRSQERRMIDLELEEKNLAKEYEMLERGMYLCDLFVRQKVSLLDEQINRKFQNVRFRIFVQQINGGLKEDCEVLVPSPDGRMVPFASANNAARINAALEIVELLADHWQMDLPVFVDNAESVTDLYHSEQLQIVRLVVSKLHASLTLRRDSDKTVDAVERLMGLDVDRLQQLLQMVA